jgi:hypothetical protein
MHPLDRRQLAMVLLRATILLFLVVLSGRSVCAQDSTAASPDTTRSWQEAAWTPIVEREGLAISFIFYSEAENRNDGVVVRLRNENDYPVRYAFTIIFRGPEAEATAPVQGTLTPGEMQTGSDSGLFWVPFEDEQSIGEVGLRNLRVTRLPIGALLGG